MFDPNSGTGSVSVPTSTIKAGLPSVASNIATSYSTGDPTLIVIGGGINLFVDWVKNWKYFPEEILTVPLVIALSFGVAFLVWHLKGSPDPTEPIIHGFGNWVNAHTNYKASTGANLGVVGPTKPENKFKSPFSG